MMECQYCGDDHGDNEMAHGDPVVIREGASTRTGDDLSVTFLEDVADLYALTFPSRTEGKRLEVEATAGHWRNRLPEGGWLPDDDDAMSSEALTDDVRDAENLLSEAGYLVSWDDGYLIVKAHPVDCLMCANGEHMEHNYENPRDHENR